MTNTPLWLELARELYSISQAGLAYSKNDFDLERYHRLQQLSAEVLAAQTALSAEEILAAFTAQVGYATPKIDVRGVVFRAGKLLLVQEVTDGRWAIPGGWADLGEAPAAMVEREVREESGLTVRASKLIAVYDANRLQPQEFFSAYKLVFLCEYQNGEPTPSMETPAGDFFDPLALPPLSLFRTNPAMIREALAHLADPQRKTWFD